MSKPTMSIAESNHSNPLVKLSVSGSPFTIPREVIAETDWILNRITNPAIPWRAMDGDRYYIDADPVAFRWALHYVRTKSVPSDLAKSELEALFYLAAFLRFEKLLKAVNDNLKAIANANNKKEKQDRPANSSDVKDLKKSNDRRARDIETKIDVMQDTLGQMLLKIIRELK